jgi:hypothetical protein
LRQDAYSGHNKRYPKWQARNNRAKLRESALPSFAPDACLFKVGSRACAQAPYAWQLEGVSATHDYPSLTAAREVNHPEIYGWRNLPLLMDGVAISASA